jgi:hypothetical protein
MEENRDEKKEEEEVDEKEKGGKGNPEEFVLECEVFE